VLKGLEIQRFVLIYIADISEDGNLEDSFQRKQIMIKATQNLGHESIGANHCNGNEEFAVGS
jgi:hypothetical protein